MRSRKRRWTTSEASRSSADLAASGTAAPPLRFANLALMGMPGACPSLRSWGSQGCLLYAVPDETLPPAPFHARPSSRPRPGLHIYARADDRIHREKSLGPLS